MRHRRRGAATVGSKGLSEKGPKGRTFSLESAAKVASLRPLMKRFSILPLLALAFVFGACEKHPVSDLPPEGATAFGAHAWKPGDAEKPEGQPAGEAVAPVKTEAVAVPVAEGKPADAPKFFPENK